jgi:hypothetical protein
MGSQYEIFPKGQHADLSKGQHLQKKVSIALFLQRYKFNHNVLPKSYTMYPCLLDPLIECAISFMMNAWMS